MNITTFYSYKGGVGRTLALVNVATYLAQIGRRVLIVDFDLEAPGLDTFNLPTDTPITNGLVDYVSQYLSTHESPNVEDFVYEVPSIGERGGGLWIMPSGRRDDTYASNLFGIDWQNLYEEHDGFLLFEDLKAQWEHQFAPDYVFIDSRTGHTDHGGICTRQLPGNVVILFFPNEQNLRGLKTVVSEIRSESHTKASDIKLFFVMSNVPDLDDEHDILAERIRAFRKELGIRKLYQVHRYDSLALLNQSIFTKDRPTSRLAREYINLANAIQQANPQDREGALAFLRDLSRHRPHAYRVSRPAEIADRLSDIRAAHPRDPEILTYLASIRMEQGDYEQALTHLNDAEAFGDKTAALLVNRARCHLMLDNQDAALHDLLSVLRKNTIELPSLGFAIRTLRELKPETLSGLPTAPVIKTLSPEDTLWVSSLLDSSREEIAVSRTLIESILSDSSIEKDLAERATDDLGMNLITLGCFREAREILSSPTEGEEPTPSARRIFNYAIADWGLSGSPSPLLFQPVLQRDAQRTRPSMDANYTQCLAIANWACDQREEAEASLARARQALQADPIPTFSCWRYLTVSPAVFAEDLDAIQSLIEGADITPPVLTPETKVTQ